MSIEQFSRPKTNPMESFNGTPLEPIVRGVLEGLGYNPETYSPEAEGHEHYRGLPVMNFESQHVRQPSPIITALHEGLKAGEFTYEEIRNGTARFTDENDSVVSHLMTYGAVELRKVEQNDQDSDDVLGYFVPLSSDGGRKGYVLLSANSIEQIQE
jgi:hypothetical protein